MTAPDAPTTSTPSTLAPDATFDALEHAGVVRWWQTTAFLRVAGPDALTLLDGLCTQAVERIEPGHAVLGLFLDAKAKLIAPATLHRVADQAWPDPRTAESHPDAPALLLETLPELIEPLRAHLAKYKLRAKVSLEPVDIASIAVIGATASSSSEAGDGAGDWSQVAEQSHPTHAFLADHATCAQLVGLLPERGVGLADPDALEAARIDAGVAGLHDLLPGRMPAEIGGMRAAVALDAGCYLGQEPVARLHYRGHANRTLRRLRADGDIVPASAPLDADGQPDLDAALALRRPDDADDARPVGRLTTWARHPDGGTVALAVLRREIVAGQPLRLAGTNVVLEPIDDAEAG